MSLKYWLKHQFMAADERFYGTYLQRFPLNLLKEKILVYMMRFLILLTLKSPTHVML